MTMIRIHGLVHGRLAGVRYPQSCAYLYGEAQFQGIVIDDWIEHLNQFTLICNTVELRGMAEANKMRLFPFYLKLRVKKWYKILDLRKIQTWADLRQAFMKKYFSLEMAFCGLERI